jgi:hypothetical protein
MELQIIQIVVQVVLTILGWAIVVWWAIEQAKIAHKNNMVLQVNLVKETHKSILRNELLEIYKSIVQAASTLKWQLQNYYLNESDGNNEIRFGSLTLNEDINITYAKLSEEMNRLAMWLKITNAELQHIKSIENAQVEFRRTFTADATGDELHLGQWVRFQGMLMVSKNPIKSNSEDFRKTMKKLDTSLEAIMNSLADGVSEINQTLINA